MRKIYTRFLFTAVMLMVSIAASAYDFKVGGIYYNKLTGNTCEVTYRDTNYNSYSGSVSIPAIVEYDGVTYSVTSIGEHTFYSCYNLTSVIVPNGVTAIGAGAFNSCSGLTSITIPNGVTSIESTVFDFCTSLTSVTIPNSVTSIGENAFECCYSLTSVTIPDGVTSIGKYAFTNCGGLTSITIPNNVTSIADGTFNGCSDLTSVTFPSNVTNIGAGAFNSCSGLTSITIPSSVTSIGECAFESCSSLTSISIPSSVTSIGSGVFLCCSKLNEIKVESGNTVYDSRNNCNAIIETASNTLIQGCNKSVIPSGVTAIGQKAFASCSCLTSINIPSSVTSIGYEAFINCYALTSINIPNNVTSIEAETFWCCSSLTSVTIPSGVISFGNCAFYGCSSLASVTNLATTPQSLDTNVFSGIASDATLHVLPGCKAAYEAADQWKDFNIVEDAVAMISTPTISYSNGELEFSCDTEGVEYHYSYSMNAASDNGVTSESKVAFVPEFTVSVYATKDGYTQSETATKTIKLQNDGDMNSDGKVNVMDISKLVEMLLNK